MTTIRRTLMPLLAAAVLCAASAGCDSSPEPTGKTADQTSTSRQAAAADAYPMPAGWPLAEFPLPPGASATRSNATDAAVTFRIDGVDVETAREFYAATLPGLGYPDGHNANLDITRYEGNGLKVLVQDDGLSHARITITKTTA